jgi:environmental stress-induced protein Ves
MTNHRVLSPADYRRMPWKNGGGQTHEIAVQPDGAGMAAFAWRVSVAEVAQDGPFSRFPGVDRTLVLLAGNGIRLAGAGAPLDLRTLYEPVTFTGEAELDCVLADGPVRDFNLMVRRAAATGEIIVVREGGQAIAPAQAYVCYAAAGISECLIAGYPPQVVAPEHSLVVLVDPETVPPALHVYPTSAQSVALVAVIGAPKAGQ